jgi:hypothetical protein
MLLCKLIQLNAILNWFFSNYILILCGGWVGWIADASMCWEGMEDEHELCVLPCPRFEFVLIPISVIVVHSILKNSEHIFICIESHCRPVVLSQIVSMRSKELSSFYICRYNLSFCISKIAPDLSPNAYTQGGDCKYAYVLPISLEGNQIWFLFIFAY